MHLVASFDHLNTPLLWDATIADRYNWLWHEVTTYASYTAELATGVVPPIFLGRRWV